MTKLPLNKSRTIVIADFDYTLTSDEGAFTWNIMDTDEHMGAEYHKKRKADYDFYWPIEYSTAIPIEEKLPHMEKWWNKHLSLLIEYKLNQNNLIASIKNDYLRLRSGAKEFLHFLHKNNIPLIIISAGIANIIELFLKEHDLLLPNITVCGNRIVFKDDIATGIEGTLIHSLNKDKLAALEIERAGYNNRTQILMLGDTPNDALIIPESMRKNTYGVIMKTKRCKDNPATLKLFDAACDNFFEVLQLFNFKNCQL